MMQMMMMQQQEECEDRQAEREDRKIRMEEASQADKFVRTRCVQTKHANNNS